MKRSLWIFVSVILMCIMLALLFFSGTIYDTGHRTDIEPYFFQPDSLSRNRIGLLESAAELQQSELQRRLVSKYIKEYFYIVPDPENANARIAGLDPDGYYKPISERKASGLRFMSTDDVFQYWVENIAPEILKKSEEKMLRTAIVKSIKTGISGELHVTFELHTWTTPNNMESKPDIETHEMLLYVGEQDTKIVPNQSGNALRWMENKNDVARVFEGFTVQSVSIIM